MNIVGQKLRAIGPKDKLNILSISAHESYETNLALTGHNFYILELPNFKTWNSAFRQIPSNYTILKDGQIPTWLDFDLLISHNLFDQFPYFKKLAQQYDIPLVSIQHCWPYLQHWPKRQLEYLKSLKGDVNIFITDASKKAWGHEKDGICIEHAIDVGIFSPNEHIPKKPHILSVCNQFNKPERFAPCNYPLWREVTQGLPVFHVGDQCPGLGLPAKDLCDLVNHYREALIFINTSAISPIPMSLLEASACGVPCISSATCAIQDIYKHGETALLSNDPKELRQYCVELLKNQELRERLGANAHKMVMERFKIDRFVDQYNRCFREVIAQKDKKTT